MLPRQGCKPVEHPHGAILPVTAHPPVSKSLRVYVWNTCLVGLPWRRAGAGTTPYFSPIAPSPQRPLESGTPVFDRWRASLSAPLVLCRRDWWRGHRGHSYCRRLTEMQSRATGSGTYNALAWTPASPRIRKIQALLGSPACLTRRIHAPASADDEAVPTMRERVNNAEGCSSTPGTPNHGCHSCPKWQGVSRARCSP